MKIVVFSKLVPMIAGENDQCPIVDAFLLESLTGVVSDYPDARYTWSSLAEKRKDLCLLAKCALDESVRLNPQLAEAYYFRGLIQNQFKPWYRRRSTEAELDFQKAREFGFHFNMGAWESFRRG